MVENLIKKLQEAYDLGQVPHSFYKDMMADLREMQIA